MTKNGDDGSCRGRAGKCLMYLRRSVRIATEIWRTVLQITFLKAARVHTQVILISKTLNVCEKSYLSFKTKFSVFFSIENQLVCFKKNSVLITKDHVNW